RSAISLQLLQIMSLEVFCTFNVARGGAKFLGIIDFQLATFHFAECRVNAFGFRPELVAIDTFVGKLLVAADVVGLMQDGARGFGRRVESLFANGNKCLRRFAADGIALIGGSRIKFEASHTILTYPVSLHDLF